MRHPSHFVFGLACVLCTAALYGLGYAATPWNPYVLWIASLSLVTFVLYGVDKGLSKTSLMRAPELILNVLAVLGGFPGGWLGMWCFHHKSNLHRHADLWLVLCIGTLVHMALTYVWFVR